MSDRALATIREIAEIIPIENAERLEYIRIDGWWVVGQKGVYSVGQKVVYFEIDSFLPVRPEFEWLRKTSYRKMPDGTEGFRIKTIKLRGALSQGLIVPMTDFPNELHTLGGASLEVGTDVTSILGVTKYEPPASGAVLSGEAKGNFPSFIQKTDQERVQNIWKDFFNREGKNETHTWEIRGKLSDQYVKPYEVTMKLDGSSMTVYWNKGEFGVCSRNLDLVETEDNTFWKVANRLNLRAALEAYCTHYERNIALQGELMGPGIQGNREKLNDHEFYLFDIYDIDYQCKMPVTERLDVLDELNMFLINDKPQPGSDATPMIKRVPHRGIINLEMFGGSLEKVLEYVDAPSMTHPIAEGFVFKATDGKFSFKAINNRFLLESEA